MVFKLEAELMGTERQITQETIDEVKDKYDDLAESFLDTVFDVDSKLSRKEWEQIVSKK